MYSSILFLIYITLVILRKTEENKSDMTQVIREIAIENAPKKRITGDIVFLVRAYNEEEVIATTLQTILDAGYANILLVNDGSVDQTDGIINLFREKIIYLRHYKNR